MYNFFLIFKQVNSKSLGTNVNMLAASPCKQSLINRLMVSFSGPGLDTYFFLSLAVGQPSNNMDLSEIEIYLGIMIIFFLFR